MHIRSSRRLRLAALAVVPALTLGATACSDGGSERADVETLESDNETTDIPDTTAQPVTTTAASTTTAEPVDTSPSTTPETEPSVAAVTSTAVVDEPSEPLAVVRGSSLWKELQILDLRRSGDHVTLDFVIVAGEDPSNDGEVQTTSAFTKPLASNDVSGVTLIDHVNKKRHLVLQDSEDKCVCTAFVDSFVEPNSSHPHSAQFPAPPADVKSMTVAVPKFPIIDNVPLREDS